MGRRPVMRLGSNECDARTEDPRFHAALRPKEVLALVTGS